MPLIDTLIEKDVLPDSVIRWGIRRLLKQRLADERPDSAAARFANRMKLYGSIWCCVLAHPGHIHYDLLWDEPHTDKFMRPWNGTWTTVTGP